MTHSAITVNEISKAYRIGLNERAPDTFAGTVASWVRAPVRNHRRLRRLDTLARSNHSLESDEDIIWALHRVSFKVEEGEVIGIIGRNGAGKSTLLKILSRITQPSSGRAVIRGRVSSLLEVGTGFHPELTGRENIYMNGTILGMRKREIDSKFDEIVGFSGVERFLDTPIKRYSSGMSVRLAFSVAAHLEPEILIIDEVLAVGDAEFQRKCLGKMHDVAVMGRTVLFVSHNMGAVEALCTRAIQIEHGTIAAVGGVQDVIRRYRQSALVISSEEARNAINNSDHFYDVSIRSTCGTCSNVIPLGGEFILRMCICSPTPMRRPKIGVGIDSITGLRMLTVHTPASRDVIGPLEGKVEVTCRIPQLPLAPGAYSVKLALSDGVQSLESIDRATTFTVADGDLFGEGRGFHLGQCIARSEWSASREGQD